MFLRRRLTNFQNYSKRPKLSLIFCVLIILTQNNIGPSHCQTIIESTLLLNREPQLLVSWRVDLTREFVTFSLTSATLGFIGFGLSPHGGMAGMDCIIGGVNQNGEPYFTDRHAQGEAEPQIDLHQDWFLEEARENLTHTFLRFHRSLDTCDDEQDLIINGDTTRFIWSLGQTDDIRCHLHRGVASVKILDPPRPPVDTSNFSIWNIDMTARIPSNIDTMYWCTVHKSPAYSSKHHIVGFKVKLDSEEALEHNHHLALKRCFVEPGSDLGQRLESLVGHPGGACYEDDGTGFYDLMTPCGAILYSWAKGGSALFLPDDRGIPIGGDNLVEYIVLDIHLDNPKLLPGIVYDTGVQIYTTPLVREKDVGLLVIGHGPVFTQVIPPNSVNFITAGHCSSDCTGLSLPPEGLNIFNLYLHTHLSGRRLKVRHFRPYKIEDQYGNQIFDELPWISVDNNYDFDYQEGIQLTEERRLLPGDHLTVECTYDSTWRQPPSTTIGGFSTRDEMCQAIFWYYPKTTNLDVCMSQYPVKNVLDKFGIREVQDLWHGTKNPLVLKPDHMANKTFSMVLDTMVDWTEDLRIQLENSTRFDYHMDACLGYANLTRLKDASPISNSVEGKKDELVIFFTKYPKILEEYQAPPRKCERVAGRGQLWVAVNKVNGNSCELRYGLLVLSILYSLISNQHLVAGA